MSAATSIGWMSTGRNRDPSTASSITTTVQQTPMTAVRQ